MKSTSRTQSTLYASMHKSKHPSKYNSDAGTTWHLWYLHRHHPPSSSTIFLQMSYVKCSRTGDNKGYRVSWQDLAASKLRTDSLRMLVCVHVCVCSSVDRWEIHQTVKLASCQQPFTVCSSYILHVLRRWKYQTSTHTDTTSYLKKHFLYRVTPHQVNPIPYRRPQHTN